jgi:hypothetical protein
MKEYSFQFSHLVSRVFRCQSGLKKNSNSVFFRIGGSGKQNETWFSAAPTKQGSCHSAVGFIGVKQATMFRSHVVPDFCVPSKNIIGPLFGSGLWESIGAVWISVGNCSSANSAFPA